MTDELRLASAFAVSMAGALLSVPLAIRVARRFRLLDVPSGWKRHVRSTPYLGGAGLLVGLVVAAVPLADGFGRFGWILACAVALSILGTLDDKINLLATPRIAVVAGCGVILWAADAGWEIADNRVLGLLVTIVWVLGAVNALNLLDLMDGAAGSVVVAATGGISLLALIMDDILLAALAAAVCGSSIGFLRFNLSQPSRVFLGDGGSMPLGFLCAAMIMVLPWEGQVGASRVLGGVLLFGLPIFDMTFRIYSRKRRGDTLMTAGPDSIANWLRRRLPSALMVGVVLASGQGLLSSIAILAVLGGDSALNWVALGVFTLAGGLIYTLDASGFGRHLQPEEKQHVGAGEAARASAGGQEV
ncbi:MAG: undecaprenyl/decaprenyl-phosphate alpha-N-acetylglucosaminyl 1-phosphate transferase [Chloroflexi bacterium]|nr:undecaprenyl/decaprenyl-phosphate alpha-N-acetylglucosaminyl 1-phosphate transferase [Chloroflexota bacterium]